LKKLDDDHKEVKAYAAKNKQKEEKRKEADKPAPSLPK